MSFTTNEGMALILFWLYGSVALLWVLERALSYTEDAELN
mgnify:CR=1 FL=1